MNRTLQPLFVDVAILLALHALALSLGVSFLWIIAGWFVVGLLVIAAWPRAKA